MKVSSYGWLKSQKKHGFNKVIWIQAGAMISTHAGPGAFGIAGLEL